MGLSNDERTIKMVWAVHHLVRRCRDLKPIYPCEAEWLHLKELGDQAWHALLSGHSNGMFWILGGALEEDVGGPQSPWGVAVEYQCERARSEKEPYDNQFNPFDCFLSLDGLVGGGNEGPSKRALLEIYRGTEALIYGLRRYDDAFRSQYPELDKLCSDILGTCFSLMQADQDFGKAYVGNRLLKWIYGGYNDPLQKALLGIHMHHDLSRFMVECTLADVIAWDRWRLTHKDCAQNRLILALRMAGHKFYFEHNLAQLIKDTHGMYIHKDVLEREFAKCVKAHAEKEKEGSKRYADDHEDEANSVIHGYDWRDAFGLKGE